MARKHSSASLTPDQQAEADRIYSRLLEESVADLRDLANQLATTTDATIFGANEFKLRDLVQRIAAKAVEAALDERKKGATQAPA